MDKNFDTLAKRLENKIYGTNKGFIRFQLLQEDILDFCPQFQSKELTVLDAGGGTGRFSRFCSSYGHEVLLCDISTEMLSMAQKENSKKNIKNIKIVEKDFNQINKEEFGTFDLILLHGVIEWMEEPLTAINHGLTLLKPQGFLSLLVYNRNKYILKRGYNGRLLTEDHPKSPQKKLTPSTPLSPQEIKDSLKMFKGIVKLQSGIRVFNHFLKSINSLPLSSEEWIEQERLYYRTEPFASLGEHTHILWQKE